MESERGIHNKVINLFKKRKKGRNKERIFISIKNSWLNLQLENCKSLKMIVTGIFFILRFKFIDERKNWRKPTADKECWRKEYKPLHLLLVMVEGASSSASESAHIPSIRIIASIYQVTVTLRVSPHLILSPSQASITTVSRYRCRNEGFLSVISIPKKTKLGLTHIDMSPKMTEHEQ